MVIGQQTVESYYRLWGKVRSIWSYLAASGYADSYDWFVKADDDTYFVVDNLRHFLGRLPDRLFT